MVSLPVPTRLLPFLEVGEVEPQNIISCAFNHEGKSQKAAIKEANQGATG